MGHGWCNFGPFVHCWQWHWLQDVLLDEVLGLRHGFRPISAATIRANVHRRSCQGMLFRPLESSETNKRLLKPPVTYTELTTNSPNNTRLRPQLLNSSTVCGGQKLFFFVTVQPVALKQKPAQHTAGSWQARPAAKQTSKAKQRL